MLAVAVLAVAAAGASAAWPDTSTPPPNETSKLHLVRPADKPSGPVEITSVDARTTWTDKGSSVAVEVANRSGQPVTAEVWYVLADSDKTRPWAAPVGAGEPTRIDLAARGRAEVQIPVKSAPRPGVWTMSLWAHAADDKGTVPSHGVAATPLVHVLPTVPDVYRLGEPGERAVLTVLEPVGRLVGGDGSVGPDALVSVQSTTQQPVEVELRCYLAEPGTAEPWKDADAVGSYVVKVSLSDAVPEMASCKFRSVPRDGEWELSAFVHRSGTPDTASHEDGLYSRQAVRFRNPGLNPYPFS